MKSNKYKSFYNTVSLVRKIDREENGILNFCLVSLSDTNIALKIFR